MLYAAPFTSEIHKILARYLTLCSKRQDVKVNKLLKSQQEINDWLEWMALESFVRRWMKMSFGESFPGNRPQTLIHTCFSFHSPQGPGCSHTVKFHMQ